ncbi:hypothetical protein SAMN05444159_6955 [Bradyrhizobium lablabi]|uniref:Uncharacterized protein n=1 Tax=Bradyrhizobium lablabi TaxID=722472 RepID=A0A1M7DWW6_9BRAD|nr:hypothetical protein [Bradyrhizobium lablabi]SHL83937.1 hypothetical protein SAMN05444159_6955 [Bradyrhizobium lablabi]
MTKSILVSLAILTLSTSAVLAAQRTHHRQAMNANAGVGAAGVGAAGVGASPVFWTGGVSSSDHAMYIKNLHDSGYNTKNNFNASGNVAQ